VDEISRERSLKNETFFQESNMLDLDGRLVLPAERVDVICECAWRGCVKRIRMRAADYIAAHDQPNRFVVIPGHEIPEIEKVVEEHDGYSVIEKLARHD